MALRITKSADPIRVETLVACSYGVPGLGKTSTAFTCLRPLLLDFDHGAYRSANRGDTVQVESWDDVAAISLDDLSLFATVVVDTAGRALDCLSARIIQSDPKMGRGAALTLQGYGRLKSEFVGWLRMLTSYGLDVVLLCHADEQRQGDDLLERLDVQGGSKNEIYKSADVMGRLYLAGGKRMLNFSPTDTAFGKNPGQLPPLAVPDFSTDPKFLGDVLATIKGRLNSHVEAQTEAAKEQAAWSERLAPLTTPEQFTALIGDSKSFSSPIKRMIVKAAKSQGCVLNPERTAFVPEAG